MAAHKWKNNGELIADVAKLGYLHEDWYTLDATYGEGVFWKVFRPTRLVANDLDPYLGDVHHDFTDLPADWDNAFGAVVLDPPYKLNGTPTEKVDKRYGVHEKIPSKNRLSLLGRGVIECAGAVAPKGYLLVKVMDMVSNGVVHWQTDIVTAAADLIGLRKVDRFDFLVTPRPQPERTRKCKPCNGVGCWDCVDGRVKSEQQHAARNYSTLLVFSKP